MNKQMNNAKLIGILILLLSACGPFETAPAPAEAPELMVTVTENTPSVVVANESAPEKFSKYIGLNYPPVPAGITERFSMLIEGSEDHSLWLVMEGADEMLWLGEITHYDADGAAFWEVKDVLALSHLEAGLTLIPDGCLLDGVPDHEIIIVGKDETVLLAWRANTALDMFEVIPTNGIECRSETLSVILLDIDHFKTINDRLGHAAGDECLVTLADMLQQHSRKSDIVCRYGGEEFILVLPNTGVEDAARHAEALRLLVADKVFVMDEQEIKLTISFGIASYPTHGTQHREIINKADEALYTSKRTGRNRVTVWSAE